MKNFFSFLATLLLLSFIPPTKTNHLPKQQEKKIVKKFIVKSFHRDGSDVTSSDGHSYYVTLDFNLATQAFGVITTHDVLNPTNELDVTLISGTGTTSNGNGSTIDISALSLSINGTSVTLSIPSTSDIPFD